MPWTKIHELIPMKRSFHAPHFHFISFSFHRIFFNNTIEGIQQVIYRNSGNINETAASIRNLKELEELKIDITWRSDLINEISRKFTWRSLRFGIAQLPELKKVTLTSAKLITNGRVLKEFRQHGFQHIRTELLSLAESSYGQLVSGNVFFKEEYYPELFNSLDTFNQQVDSKIPHL